MQITINMIARTVMLGIATVLSLPSYADVINVDTTSLQRLLDQGIPVIDVRRADEWQASGIIENSHLMTFFDSQGQYDAEQWQSALGAIVNPDEPVILICHSGARSHIISQWLSEKQGYATVYNVTNGMVSWQQKGGVRHPPNTSSSQ